MSVTPSAVANLAEAKLRQSKRSQTPHFIASEFISWWDNCGGLTDEDRNHQRRLQLKASGYDLSYPDIKEGCELAERLLAEARQELEAKP